MHQTVNNFISKYLSKGLVENAMCMCVCACVYAYADSKRRKRMRQRRNKYGKC